MADVPRVLLLTDPGMARHVPPGHPERPERLDAAIGGVLEGAVAGGAELERPAVLPAGNELLERVHPAAHLAALEEAGRAGSWIDPDTYVGPGSMQAARLAAGATVHAAVAVSQGPAAVAFAVVRPPGHHAAARRATGFCLLNNVAVAVLALRAAGVGRIGLVDWDVHHGDGTQELFDADPQLIYASTHQWPLYPGTGLPDERGLGTAEDTMHNLLLPPGAGDEAFAAAWTDQLLPALEAFAPEALLVSAGYDAHRDDPLASLLVTDAGFGAVAQAVGGMARRLGIHGVALTLEGGYDLEALHRSAAATVTGLLRGLRGPDGAESA